MLAEVERLVSDWQPDPSSCDEWSSTVAGIPKSQHSIMLSDVGPAQAPFNIG